MKNEMIKNTGLRTAGKAFAIIDIILGCLILIGGIAMMVGSTHIVELISPYPATDPTVIAWQTLADTLWTWGIVLVVSGPLMLAFSIVGLKLIQNSNSFVAMLVFGIVNVLIGGAPILGILMICIATMECYKKK